MSGQTAYAAQGLSNAEDTFTGVGIEQLAVKAFVTQNQKKTEVNNIKIEKVKPNIFYESYISNSDIADIYEITTEMGVSLTSSGTVILQEPNNDYFDDADYTYYSILRIAYKDAPEGLIGKTIRVISHSGQFVRKTGSTARNVDELHIIGTIYAMDFGANGTNYTPMDLPVQYENDRIVNNPTSGTQYFVYPTTSNYFWTNAFNTFVRTRMFITVDGEETPPLDMEISNYYYGP